VDVITSLDITAFVAWDAIESKKTDTYSQMEQEKHTTRAPLLLLLRVHIDTPAQNEPALFEMLVGGIETL
jgi:hypothetical protein